MKLTLSKKRREEKRHVVLLCTESEASDIHMILYNEVVDRQVNLNRERMRNGLVRYRFAMKYLDRLCLTFPFADFSQGLEAKLTAAAKAEIDAMEVPELDITGFDGELRNYQLIGVEKVSRRKSFLLLDDVGLGKSWELIAAKMHRGMLPALSLVPNGLKFDIAEKVEMLTDLTYTVMDGTLKQRRAAWREDSDLLIANHEAVRVRIYQEEDACFCEEAGGESPLEHERMHFHYRYDFKNPGLFFEDDTVNHVREIDLDDQEWRFWGWIDVDECQYFNNHNTQAAVGLHLLEARHKKGASATPVLNGRPEEYYTMLHWLWPKKYPSYEHFLEKHCVRKGSRTIAYQGLAEMKEWLDDHSLRRRKEHVLTDLPDVVYVDDWIDLTTEQRALYNEIMDRLRIWVNEEPRRIASVLAQLTRLKQACFSPELYEGSPTSAKLTRLKDLMRQLHAAGHKAIVFSQWKTATRIIERELAEYNPAYIDGTVKPKDRMAQVHKFNEEEDCGVFIGTIGACREGFTLSAATYVIFTDETWVPVHMIQAAGRSAAGGLRGEGVEGSVTIITIRANETIERDIVALLQRKQQMNNRLTERDGGAKVEKLDMSDLRSLLGWEGEVVPDLDATRVEGALPEPEEDDDAA